MNIMTEYVMNPAEDVIVFGDQLADGMLVLPEDRLMRHTFGTEDEQLRAQRFRKVTQLTVLADAAYGGGALVRFVGEWVDGYQEVHRYSIAHAWLVKKDSLPAEEPTS